MTPRLVLASTSPRRAAILRTLGLDPLVCPSGVDEAYQVGETPGEHVDRLAREKAEASWRGEIDTLVVGGDTVVLDCGRVLTKPEDESAAVAMLLSLSGGTHEVLSGIAITGAHGTVSAVSRTVVRMRTFGERTAIAYVATGEPLDKAGAYGLQGQGAALVEGIDGDYYTVVGFPVGAFVVLLERAGWRFEFGSLTQIQTE